MRKIGKFLVKCKWMQKCANVNFLNWCTMPKTWIVIGVMSVFSLWNLSGVFEYSVESGIRCTPFIYPHFFSMPVMCLVYGFLTIALFSDAPFHNAFSDFLKIRTGNRIWIIGQCLFVVEVSLVYSLAYFLLSVIMILPRIIVIKQWGTLIELFAFDSEAASHLTGICFTGSIIKEYTPIKATLLTIAFVWLVSCFLGMLILMCRIVFGGHVGSAVSGVFVFLAYFCVFIGNLVFGSSIYKISPVSWINIDVFRGGDYPDLMYRFSFLITGIIISIIVGSLIYEKKGL